MSRKLRKNYPALSIYLEAPKRNPVQDRVNSVLKSGVPGILLAMFGGAALLGFGVGALAGGVIYGVFGAFLGFVSGAVGGGLMLNRLLSRARKPRHSSESLIQDAEGASHQLLRLAKERKLHRWLDPVAGQLLEAGAYHWKRVRDNLSTSAWYSRELPGHWEALRERSLEAADTAMAELLVMCMGCVGEPGKSRDDDWKEVFEDFFELDFVDALQGLREVAGKSEKDYSFQSPEVRVIFEPGRKIAERLKELADQVEGVTFEVRSEVGGVPAGAFSAESLDVLVGEFKAIKQAEEELHQSQGH